MEYEKELRNLSAVVCDLKGSVIAKHMFTAALLRALPPDALQPLLAEYEKQVEGMRTELLNTRISELTIDAFERDSHQVSTTIQDRLARLS